MNVRFFAAVLLAKPLALWAAPATDHGDRRLPEPAVLPKVARSSAGIELRWEVPGVELPVRVHYALNPLRLSRALLLPDGSRFRPPNRRTALSWAFGTMF